jgi:hypothetical protein
MALPEPTDHIDDMIHGDSHMRGSRPWKARYFLPRVRSRIIGPDLSDVGGEGEVAVAAQQILRGLGGEWEEVGVEVDVVIAFELVAELVAELGKEARVDQDLGAGVDACFALGGVSLVPTARENGC